ncbi:hypothetical protein NEPAR06_0488 [Nematocida parisii]|uniref:Uncharacterized protein n=1 Tax=Nematocida parisii (strain ERTm3) TaxID=935791 RepID=I3EJG8_NEMP3|nr:uncharacterized protein NEPG_01104 [Nematocida parisii ERTm1]EIJ89365.1 hypothetical protein NEQG_00135 [Nematocida parisii ERTm3]KAI5127432.1 hypothetical protein NEPAR08_0873 [Nematocida parisii]EIJ94436.1 hypothetical protein NEPG_01104 [Nematocida parisii ERTm1]KAI5129051.1 hypothetical protein NEPAR03_1497 [Nematocida parisii]KAI5141325.1 hypothetical protein NEPAR04_0887 [Nematocida parisii]|eukprot:XP_013058932.1 hypothetical protein NEPG_01104 [Nematocida parisii ERTm1]
MAGTVSEIAAKASIQAKEFIEIPADNIYVYRLDFKQIMSKLFKSVYTPEKDDFIYNSIKIRFFEGCIIGILLIVMLFQLYVFINNMPVVDLEIKGFKGEYDSPFQMSDEQKKIREKMNCAMFSLANEKSKKDEDSSFDVNHLIKGISYELSAESCALSMPEYIAKKFTAESGSILKTISSIAIVFIFFIRGTGICTNAFTAMLESNTFFGSFIVGLQIALHLSIFTIFIIMIFDKNGRVVSTLIIAFTNIITYGVACVINGIQDGVIKAIFAMFSSDMFKNVFFSFFGIVLHGILNLSLEIVTSSDADSIVDFKGMGNYTALINDASKLKKYKTEAMKGLGLVGKWNDLWDSDIRCIEACSAFKGNFYVFIGFVLLSYIIIYEVDMTWIYNTLLYAPDIRPFTSIRRNITTKGILKFKLITYIGALVGCWALFRIFSM